MKKRIAILGADAHGISAARLALRQGHAVFVSNNGQIPEVFRDMLHFEHIPYDEGSFSEDVILKADQVVKSPMIKIDDPILAKVEAEGIPLLSEIDFASAFCRGTIIAVTGTNGKSTTARLIQHLLVQSGKTALVAGTKDNSFSDLADRTDVEYFIIECSARQLTHCLNLQPKIAVLTNITQDHIDHFGFDLKKYQETKFNLLQNMGESEMLIYNADDYLIKDFLNANAVASRRFPVFADDPEVEIDCAFLDKKAFVIQRFGHRKSILRHFFPLQGAHNAKNIALAISAVVELGVSIREIGEKLICFEQQQHRIQYITEVDGIAFYDDSKARNVAATKAALSSFLPKIHWIAGGRDLGNDYASLKDVVQERVKSLICVGQNNGKMRKYFTSDLTSLHVCPTIEEAVQRAFELASDGEIILFSPSCTTYKEEFPSYLERGKAFRQAIWSLEKSTLTHNNYARLASK